MDDGSVHDRALGDFHAQGFGMPADLLEKWPSEIRLFEPVKGLQGRSHLA